MRFVLLVSVVVGGLICRSNAALAQVPIGSGNITTIAGSALSGYSGDGGLATDAALNYPQGAAIGPDGALYFTDRFNNRIRRVDAVTGTISTIAGDGTQGDEYQLPVNTGDGGPATQRFVRRRLERGRRSGANILYLADDSNNRVRQVDLSTGTINGFAGVGPYYPFSPVIGERGDGGPATGAWFAPFVYGVAVGPSNNVLISSGSRVSQVDGSTGIIDRIAGLPYSGTGGMSDISAFTGDGGPASAATFVLPWNLKVDAAGNIFVIDIGGNVSTGFEPPRVREIDAATGIIHTIAGGGVNPPGTGPATSADLTGLLDVAVDNAGSMYLATYSQVFKMDLSSGQLSPFAGTSSAGFAGDGGPATLAQFQDITALTVAPGGGLLISDSGNSRIRFVGPQSVDLTNSQQTEIHLPWINSVSGSVSVNGNTAATSIDASSLTNVGGGVSVNGNTAATSIDASSLTNVGGGVSVNGNTAATSIDASSLTNVGGGVSVNGNTAATSIDASSLTNVGGSVSVNGNTAATSIDASSLTNVGGGVSVNGNTAATSIDASSLTNVGGNVDVNGNNTATAVMLGSATTVSGNMDVETSSQGTVDFSGVAVQGDSSVSAKGATTLMGQTAGGSTEVTLVNGSASMTAMLPADTFTTPVQYALHQVTGSDLDPQAGSSGATVDPVAAYQLSFDAVSLNEPASVTLEIMLDQLPDADRMSLLAALDDHLLTLAVKGDQPDSQYLLFRSRRRNRSDPRSNGAALGVRRPRHALTV